MTTIWSKSVLISQIFLKLNEMKWIVHDFWLSFTINNEQIVPNLNIVFANKYDKIQQRNFDNFWEISNSLISLLRIFFWIGHLKKVSAFGYQFCLLWKPSKLPSIFLGFWNIQSVKQSQIMNSKKALFAAT
jgi:hypothetical protein